MAVPHADDAAGLAALGPNDHDDAIIQQAIGRRSAEDIIEIGRDLLSVKAALPHGSFLPWIEAEFGMTARSAQNFMSVAEKFGGKYETVARLAPTALYALASAEPEVQSRIEAMLAAGEVVKRADVDALRREAESARKAAERASTDADAAELAEQHDLLKDALDGPATP